MRFQIKVGVTVGGMGIRLPERVTACRQAQKQATGSIGQHKARRQHQTFQLEKIHKMTGKSKRTVLDRYCRYLILG